MKNINDSSWDRLIKKKSYVFFPATIKDLNSILKTKINKNTFVLKTGGCSYFDKSFGPGKYTINLKNFNKININKNKTIVDVGTGVILSELVNFLQKKKLTLYTLPGGNNISIGGAVSANVIGKSSSKKHACFGDSIISLNILTKNGKIKKLKKNFQKYVGAFGTQGIILSAELKLMKIQSQNLSIYRKKIESISDLKDSFKKKHLYKYSIINPFDDKNNFGIFISANFCLDKNLYQKKTNLNKYIIIFLMKIINFFYYQFFLKIFYKILFLLRINKNYKVNFYDFHHKSDLFTYLPHAYRDGLVEIEILIDNINYISTFKKFFNKNMIFPKYIVVKKQYKSKNNFFYEFSNDGYSVAITFDNLIVKKNIRLFKSFYKYLKKEKLKLNLTKNSLFKKSFKKYDKFKKYPAYKFESYFLNKDLIK